jgi:OOP family OmpA-OmpF porin
MKRVGFQFKFKSLGLTVPLAALVLSGCAQLPSSSPFAPYTPKNLNPLLQSGEYTQKVDNFVVVMDASSSMVENYRAGGFPEADGPNKLTVQREFLSRMNQTIPNLKLNSAIRSFGFTPCVAWDSTLLNAPMGPYTKDGFQAGLNTVECGFGASPVDTAIEASTADLASVSGKTAVILVTDGQNPRRDPVPAVQQLKASLGDRACLHTVYLGEPGKPGMATLEKLPAEMGCGTFTMVGDAVTPDGSADFVKKVFLERNQGPLDSDQDGVLDPQDECPGTPLGAKVNRVGCWVLNDVLFDTDKAVIKPVSYRILNDVVSVFERNPDLTVEVQGHTDNQGSYQHNMGLSQRRADSVKTYLVRHGVKSGRLTTKGFGYTVPVATNDTEAGRALNRRVEMKVFK